MMKDDFQQHSRKSYKGFLSEQDDLAEAQIFLSF